MLKEEGITIKESLQDSSFNQFRAVSISFEWLDKRKSAYTIKERQIVGEAGDVAAETITSWMERIQELTVLEGTCQKISGIWTSLVAFLRLCMAKD